MDNQNANKGGIVGSVHKILDGKTEDDAVKRATDASGLVDNASVIVQPNKYENIQSQSIVESTRETASEELAQIEAYNREMLRQQHMQEAKNKAKRTTIYVIIGIFGLFVFVVLGWMLVNAIMSINTPPAPTKLPEPPTAQKYDKVDGYDCKTSKCYKVEDLIDGRIILRDDMYYVYDIETKELSLTSIENQEYHNVKSFAWGGDNLVVLDPESDYSGLYSVSKNQMLVGFKYDNFYIDANDKVYAEMKSYAGKYIIARKDGLYRLVDVSTGQELIHGSEGVLIHDNFLASHENGGERRLYTLSGSQIAQVLPGEHLFIKGSYGLHVNSKGSFALYNPSGEKVRSNTSDEYKRINAMRKTIVDTLRKEKQYFEVVERN